MYLCIYVYKCIYVYICVYIYIYIYVILFHRFVCHILMFTCYKEVKTQCNLYVFRSFSAKEPYDSWIFGGK